ncbi:MAG: HAMP domain-containing histidine kinase [Ignavibacteriae bacterium]|nr:HAMP domain-containing histidine kinase [Ignavibacteriota bacterium]
MAAAQQDILLSKTTIPQTSNVKIALLILAFIIVGSTLWYTHSLVEQLQKKEKDVADLYARSLQYLADPNTPEGDYSFILDEIVAAIDFPVIQTDEKDEPVWDYKVNTKNVALDTSLSREEQRAYLKSLIVLMDEYNTPIKVTVRDTIVLSYIHYGESPLVTRLRWLPYVELFFVAIFIFIGYMSFSYIKSSEQSNIWVGMARETAHQLGTPISSMMGWIELLKHQMNEHDKSSATVRDMENDVARLQKIADRFSKIGSKPDLKDENLSDIIEKVIQYYRRRIPQSGKKVQLSLKNSTPVFAKVNRELFEWVLENLIKNALDAIEKGEGKISIVAGEDAGSIFVDVSDNGKGIDMKFRNDIFKPGYSTKSRGWGLGLSLAQRIVESYHDGKLYVKDSSPGGGATFRIKLRSN